MLQVSLNRLYRRNNKPTLLMLDDGGTHSSSKSLAVPYQHLYPHHQRQFHRCNWSAFRRLRFASRTRA